MVRLFQPSFRGPSLLTITLRMFGKNEESCLTVKNWVQVKVRSDVKVGVRGNVNGCPHKDGDTDMLGLLGTVTQ